MSKVTNGIRLIFYAPVAGVKGDLLVVTQDEWDTQGSTEYVTAAEKPNLRELAARFS